MVEAIKFVASNYKKLRKQTRDLQGEIEPTIKQCKRDMLRTLAEIDQQYKEMLRKYRKEMALRKKLHTELVDLTGNSRVFARIR
jgi:kinesin family protein C2/C3